MVSPFLPPFPPPESTPLAASIEKTSACLKDNTKKKQIGTGTRQNNQQGEKEPMKKFQNINRHRHTHTHIYTQESVKAQNLKP